VAGVCALTASQVPAPAAELHYLGEVGHLGSPSDRRTSVRLGHARVVLQGDGYVRFEGQDDHGERWTAILPTEGGIGWTDVWQADFDRNARPDLLVASVFPSSGRCDDEVTLAFLLFNARGQPVPWVTQTSMPKSTRSLAIPAVFHDLNHGRPELVVTNCAYSDPPRQGEDLSIIGIYEAKDATWSLSRPTSIAPYERLVRRSYRFRPNDDELLPTDPTHWLDRGNKMESMRSPSLQVAAVLPASAGCRGVRLPPIDGAIRTAVWKDPCEELGKDRLQLSNGTVCYGWPTVVLDAPSGREIMAEPKLVRPLLQQIVDQRRTVILTGETEPGRCSPSVLWAPRERQ